MPVTHVGLRGQKPLGSAAPEGIAVAAHPAGIEDKIALQPTRELRQRHHATEEHAEEHTGLAQDDRLYGPGQPVKGRLNGLPVHQEPGAGHRRRTARIPGHQLRVSPGRASASSRSATVSRQSGDPRTAPARPAGSRLTPARARSVTRRA